VNADEAVRRAVRRALQGADDAAQRGADAVRAWNRRIHGKGSPRFAWGEEVSDLLQRDGALACLPPYPSLRRDTQASRDETVRRIYREAAEA
jgi:hypothetical protein